MAPKLAVADGALGFWQAIEEVWPQTRGQRCWVHKTALIDGVRESAQSWKELLLDLKRRGLAVAPKLAVADGALGFWQAIEEVWPQTRGQRSGAERERGEKVCVGQCFYEAKVAAIHGISLCFREMPLL